MEARSENGQLDGRKLWMNHVSGELVAPQLSSLPKESLAAQGRSVPASVWSFQPGLFFGLPSKDRKGLETFSGRSPPPPEVQRFLPLGGGRLTHAHHVRAEPGQLCGKEPVLFHGTRREADSPFPPKILQGQWGVARAF